MTTGFQRVLTRVRGVEQRQTMGRVQRGAKSKEDRLLTFLRSGLYPFFTTLLVTPRALRPPERLRIDVIDLPPRTECGELLVLRVVMMSPEPESLISILYLRVSVTLSRSGM